MNVSAGTSGLVPPAFVTVTSTEPVPAGAMAVTLVDESLVMLAAGLVPNSTPLSPARFVPEMTTEVPPEVGPATGAMEVTWGVGTGLTVKLCWTCGAGLKVSFPAWLASRVQVPGATKVTTPESSMLHAPSEDGSFVITGVSPDVAVAVGV